MVTPVPLSRRLKSAAIVFGGLFAGLALLAVPPVFGWRLIETWLFGVPLTAVFGYVVVVGVRFRLRYPTPEARAAAREAASGTGPGRDAGVRRGYFANQATKYRDEVLAGGVDGTAVITFLADTQMRRGSRPLVYLELDVTVGLGAPYQARTGDHVGAAASGSMVPGRRLAVKVDPADPQRVTIDWERSLRLS